MEDEIVMGPWSLNQNCDIALQSESPAPLRSDQPTPRRTASTADHGVFRKLASTGHMAHTPQTAAHTAHTIQRVYTFEKLDQHSANNSTVQPAPAPSTRPPPPPPPQIRFKHVSPPPRRDMRVHDGSPQLPRK